MDHPALLRLEEEFGVWWFKTAENGRLDLAVAFLRRGYDLGTRGGGTGRNAAEPAPTNGGPRPGTLPSR